MALTQEEIQSVINAVISAIRTNSRMISQLTPVTTLSDTDSFEIGVGKRVAYSILNQLINAPNVEKAAQTDAALSRLAEADTALSARINGLTSALNAETTGRRDADSALSERIGDEELTRAAAVKALRDFIVAVSAKTDLLSDSIGKATVSETVDGETVITPGIAPLNEQGVIASKFLPSFVDDVMDFDGLVTWEGSFAGKEYKGDLSEVDHRVLFHPAASRFILEVTPVSSTGKPQTPEYYPAWALEENQQLCLGAATAVGYTPLKSKTYYCPATTVSYRWNGTSMAPCGSHLELGKEVNTAYPGDAGKLLEDTKADRTELSGVLSRDPEEELAAAEPDFLTLMLRKNEQVLTDEERRQVMENLGRPDIEWLITYFNYMANRYVAGYGGYNKATGFFELGTVKNLTVQDAIKIVLSPQGISGCSITDSNAEGRMAHSEVRALFPIKLSAGALGQSNFILRYYGCTELEEVVFLRNYGSFVNNSFYRAFYDCQKLRVLKFGYTSVATCTFEEAFENCHALEDFTPPYFWASMKLYDSPKLSVESLERIIARATPPKGDTKGITITLHADAFARLSDELMAAAAEKNITLTTP